MERPERPTRHKSNLVFLRPKRMIRPMLEDTDSDSDQNDEVPVLNYFTPSRLSEQDPFGEGPSTSSGVPQVPSHSSDPAPTASSKPPSPGGSGSQSNAFKIKLPRPVRMWDMAPSRSSPQEEETRSENQCSINKLLLLKRAADSCDAASVIFESVDSIINNTTNNSQEVEENNEQPEPERRSDRFHHTDFLIRPRSFCNMESSFSYKPKRLSAPIDLTSSITSTSAATRSDDINLPVPPIVPMPNSLLDMDSSYLSSRAAHVPPFIPPRRDPQPSNSSILRQFDEICSTNNQMRRLRPRNPFSSQRESPRVPRAQADDYMDVICQDYCNMVGRLLNTNSPSLNNQETPQRGESREGEISLPESQQETVTADIIRQVIGNTTSDDMFIDMARSDLPTAPSVGAEITVESNDDVIVVETPERPPLPTSPSDYMVPSSRSPTPTRPSTPPVNPPKRAKFQCGEVPMTLQDLNQTLVALLECPVCLDHATPPIYQCVKGHILCQSCHPRLSSCPICRSRLPGDRNSSMEKVAEKLMYPCKNTVTGCTEMLKLDDKQTHEDGCGFRHYACIRPTCQWKGYKPELVVHLQSVHPDTLITGAKKEVQVPLTGSLGGSMFVAHNWIQSAHNEVFNVIFHVDLCKRIMKGCVIYIGAPEKAEKFVYLFELVQHVAPFRMLTYSRTTHPDTVRPQQSLYLSNDFTINIDMARIYRPDNCLTHTIPVTVSISPIDARNTRT